MIHLPNRLAEYHRLLCKARVNDRAGGCYDEKDDTAEPSAIEAAWYEARIAAIRAAKVAKAMRKRVEKWTVASVSVGLNQREIDVALRGLEVMPSRRKDVA